MTPYKQPTIPDFLLKIVAEKVLPSDFCWEHAGLCWCSPAHSNPFPRPVLPTEMLTVAAMVEAQLNSVQFLSYISQLKMEVYGSEADFLSITTRMLWEATALQRLTAAIKILGHWPEGK